MTKDKELFCGVFFLFSLKRKIVTPISLINMEEEKGTTLHFSMIYRCTYHLLH